MAERWFVAPEVAGSKPVAHPILPPLSQDEGVFVCVPLALVLLPFIMLNCAGVTMNIIQTSDLPSTVFYCGSTEIIGGAHPTWCQQMMLPIN